MNTTYNNALVFWLHIIGYAQTEVKASEERLLVMQVSDETPRAQSAKKRAENALLELCFQFWLQTNWWPDCPRGSQIWDLRPATVSDLACFAYELGYQTKATHTGTHNIDHDKKIIYWRTSEDEEQEVRVLGEVIGHLLDHLRMQRVAPLTRAVLSEYRPTVP